jgi:hypothetical protein
MGLLRLFQDGRLFLLCLALLPVGVIPGAVWKERTPVLVLAVSTQVVVVVKEDLIVVIVTVVLVVMLEGFIVDPPVCCWSSVLIRRSCLFHIKVLPR